MSTNLGGHAGRQEGDPPTRGESEATDSCGWLGMRCSASTQAQAPSDAVSTCMRSLWSSSGRLLESPSLRASSSIRTAGQTYLHTYLPRYLVCLVDSMSANPTANGASIRSDSKTHRSVHCAVPVTKDLERAAAARVRRCALARKQFSVQVGGVDSTGLRCAADRAGPTLPELKWGSLGPPHWPT